MEQPELERELHDLVRRVSDIERHLGLARQGHALPEAVLPQPTLPKVETSALLPALGRLLLGLAGAYLLRALTEWGTLGATAGVGVGIVYAVSWLIWAARLPASRRVEAALYSLTSALVIAPLLFEATHRFHAVSTWSAGALLVLFNVSGLAASWRKDLLVVATIATLTGVGTASALLVATHDALPFTFVLLAIAAAVEASACLEHWLSERWLAATAADLAVLLATWLVTNERGLPAAYAPIPHAWLLMAQMALLAVYLSSTIVRTLLRGFTFTGFETAQCAMAFLIGVGGGVRLSNLDRGVEGAMGALTLACAAACYVVSFVRLDRQGARGRNFYTYSTFGILLALAGTRILLSGAAAWMAWTALAIACIAAGGWFGRLTLQVHGAIFLALAVFSSGAVKQAAALLLGSAAWGEQPLATIGGAGMAALICYLVAVRYSAGAPGEWTFQTFRLGLVGMLAFLLAGLLAGALTAVYHAAFGAEASHAYCATMRTGVVTLAAMLLAWVGSRWNNMELSRLIYPAMLAGAYRLLVEDLHQDRKAALFLSLLLFGGALMALPRLRKTPQGSVQKA